MSNIPWTGKVIFSLVRAEGSSHETVHGIKHTQQQHGKTVVGGVYNHTE